jgi:hypothetical protein
MPKRLFYASRAIVLSSKYREDRFYRLSFQLSIAGNHFGGIGRWAGIFVYGCHMETFNNVLFFLNCLIYAHTIGLKILKYEFLKNVL